MTKIKPIQFDGNQELEKLKDDSQKTSEYIEDFKARFSTALPNVTPKVEELLNEALERVHQKVKEPSFIEALLAAEAQGPNILSKFHANFQSAVSRAIPSQFPVAMEKVVRNVRVVSTFGNVSMEDRLVPEMSMEQTYFGAVLYKHGRQALLSAVSDLANGNSSEKASHAANFEHVAGAQIQRSLAAAKEELRHIHLATVPLQRMVATNTKNARPNSEEDEHSVIYSSMLRGLGMTEWNDGDLVFNKSEDLDNVRKRVNRALKDNRAKQKNDPDRLSISNALVGGVEGNMGSIDDAPKGAVSRISSAFKSVFHDSQGGPPSSKPPAP